MSEKIPDQNIEGIKRNIEADLEFLYKFNS